MPEIDGLKLVIVTSGSRGDIQPFLSCGLALIDVGFKVSIVTGPEHEALCKSIPGIDYYSNGCSFADFFAGPETEALWTSGEFYNYGYKLTPWRAGTALAEMKEIVKAIQAVKPDLIITAGPMHEEMFSWVPKVFDVPALQTMLMPQHGCGVYKPFVWLPPHESGDDRQWNYMINTFRKDWIDWYGPAVEELTGKKVDDWKPTVPDWGLSFGLDGFGPKLEDAAPMLIMAPEEYAKKPEDPPSMIYTGYPSMPQKIEESKGSWGGEDTEKLEAFLAGGAPVYIGFGSMKCMAAEKMTKFVVKSLKLAQQRGIVLGGWGGLAADKLEDSLSDGTEAMVKATGEIGKVYASNGHSCKVAGKWYHADELKSEGAILKEYAEKNILFLKAAKHEVLFPKCSVLVHHAGHGTMFTAMKSGTPSVVTPIHLDQLDNGGIIAGAGGGAVIQKHLSAITAEELSAEITKVLSDKECKAKCVEIGKVLSAQDGAKKFAEECVKFTKEMVLTGKFMEKVKAGVWVGKAPEPEKAKEAGA